VGFGHGKVILLGEHTVVFGHPGLVAALPVGVEALVRPGEGRILAPAWQLDARVGDESPVGQAMARLFDRLGAEPLDVELVTGIPCRAGLGSSAAMAVAVARAVGARTGASVEAITAAAHASEEIFHGTPSGADTAAAQAGGLGRFRKDTGWQPVAPRQPITLCVGLSGRPRQTAALVEAVATLCRRTPVAHRLIDTLAEATSAGEVALVQGDVDGLGRLFDLAHGALAGLRLSTPELDRMVHDARAAGAIGAKLTGAGGGGAVIALAPSHAHDVLERWRAGGFDGFVAVVGAARP
jgi:mevalonate kinase